MDIVAGTYEQLLLGFRLAKENVDSNDNATKVTGYQFTQSFTDHNHIGCVKSIAISKKGVLASGSTDETVQLMNLKKRVEIGSLVHHEGAVTDLTFHNSSHLFSVSEDASVCLWKYKTWQCLRTLRGHKDAINSLSVHPSGKLALTVGKDNTLRTWNLVTGRPAFITNTSQVGESVRWSPKGDYYAILYPNSIDVYHTATASVHCKIESKPAMKALTFCQDAVLAYSAEGGHISFHDVTANSHLHTINNDTKRVKCMTCEKCPDDASKTWLVTGSSNGLIKVWQLQFQDLATSFVVAETNTGFRITCISALSQALDVRTRHDDSTDEEEASGMSEVSESGDDSSDEVITVERRSTRVTSTEKTEYERNSKEGLQNTGELKLKKPSEKRQASKQQTKAAKSSSVKSRKTVGKLKRKSYTEDAGSRKKIMVKSKSNSTTKFIVTEQV